MAHIDDWLSVLKVGVIGACLLIPLIHHNPSAALTTITVLKKTLDIR